MVKIHIQTSRLGTQQNFVQYKNRATQHTDTLITRQILSRPSQKSTQRQKRKTNTPHIGRSTQHELRQNGSKKFASTQTKHKYQQKHKQINIFLPSTVKANFSSNSIINNQKLKTQRQKRKTTTPHIGRSTQHELQQNGGKCLQVRRQNISTNKNTNK